MKIQGISTIYNNRIYFGENQLYVYADFDRTLSPNTTGDVFYAKDKKKIECAKYNFKLINLLLKKYKNMKLYIETGRSNDELKLMYDLYKKHNAGFLEAESVITKEGADEFIRNPKIRDDYPYSIKNQTRNKRISEQINWNKRKILNKTEHILISCGTEPLRCGTTLSAEKYGKYSIFSYPEKFKENTVLIRELGEMKLFLGFVNQIPQDTYNLIKENICNYLTENNIKFVVKEKPADRECGNLRTITFEPVINGEVLSKNYDVKEKIKFMDDNDTLVVAGDGKNDYSMLNPDSYDKNFAGEIISVVVKKPDEPEPVLDTLINNFPNNKKRKVISINEGDFANLLKTIAENKFGKNS